MAIKPLNSVAGFSVGETPTTIISANGDITTNNITTTGVANLNNISNVKIEGGVNGQIISTDGSGNLTFIDFNSSSISNGNSNVRVYQNSNITLSVAGTANTVIFSQFGTNIAGNLSVTGDITSNANIIVNDQIQTPLGKDLVIAPDTQLTKIFSSVNPFVDGSYSLGNASAKWLNTYTYNINAIGTANIANLVTSNIVGNGNSVTISAAGTNQDINLAPTGNGVVNVSGAKITNLQDPSNPQDAATKNYVDTVAEGLHVHPSCNVATTANIATLSGGTVAYNNGTGGVGANLVITGGSLTLIDTVTLTANMRILVKNEANAVWNGIYVYDSATQLTRSLDADTNSGLAGGDFTFVTSGSVYADTGWVQTTDNVVIGTSNIVWDQFSGAGTYQAGLGINIVGTVISANVDNITTAISSGNIVVKASAQLTTPNIDAATGTSLSLTGNLIAGNVNSNAKITASNAEITANILANNIRANSNIISNNTTVNLELTGNTANFSGNVIINNLKVNLELSGNTANFIGNIITLNANLGNLAIANYVNVASNVTTSNLKVNLELSGNTANFIGNITTLNANLGNLAIANYVNVASNILTNNQTINLDLSGNTANFIGNITTLNANLGNLAIANYVNVASNVITSNLKVNLDISGNTANFTGNVNTLNANLGNLAIANYVNVASNIITNNQTINLDLSGNTANFIGNVTVANLAANIITGNAANVNIVYIGNTTVTWANVTTSSVSANQTIASLSVTGITGLEFLVKSIDSSGARYSVSTVQAVTDGTTVDYTTFAKVQLGGYVGALAVNVVGGFVRLQVTPSSSNSTVWTTQIRTI